MTFPQDAIRAELLINGVWQDITSRIRGSGDITIQSGSRIDSTDLGVTTVGFTLNNADGYFTNDYPLSPLYGLIPANTNFRISMEEAAPFLYCPNGQTNDPAVSTLSTGGYIQTADKSVLDVVGDLDVRIDIEPDTWQLGNVGQILAGKFATTSNQRSWVWTIEGTGLLRLYWTTDGSTLRSSASTATVPTGARVSLRATLDVNNGASGNTVTFYTSDSVTGTWTQLGSSVVQSGTTSIFSSSAPVQVGLIRDSSSNTNPLSNFANPSIQLVGRIHRFQMYSGIAGTLVADMNATVQADNASSWSDGLTTANTWTAQNNAFVTVADYRAYGELASIPSQGDSTGRNVTVAATVSGISRRITKDPKTIKSAYRKFNEALINKLGYWAMEDKAGTIGAFTSVAGARLKGFTGLGYGSQYSPPGSDRLADVSSTSSFITYQFADSSASGTNVQIGWVARYQPFTDNPFPLLMTMDTVDTTDYVITLDVAGKIIEVFAQNTAGTILGDVTATFSDDWTEWHSFVLKLSQSGGNIRMDLYWRALDDDAWKNIGVAYSGTVSVPRFARFGGGDVPPGSTVGHVIATIGSSEDLIGETRFQAFLGYDGEPALTRWLRICRENSIRGLGIGWPADSEPMGPQPIDTVPNILDQCAATEGGIQYDARDQSAIVFRTRMSLYGQQAVNLDYAQAHLSGTFAPVDDDLLTRNSVTATNPDGSSQVSITYTGPKSILQPPNGVGEYDASVPNVNTHDLTGLKQVAAGAAWLGSWPGRRVPAVTVNLARSVYQASATLMRAVRSLNPGDRLVVLNVPIWVGGGSSDTVLRAYTEVIQNSGSARGWTFTFATVPGGPYSAVGIFGNDRSVMRLDSATSTLNASLTTTATSLSLASTGARWVDSANYPAEFPFDVIVTGEVMTITAITGTSSPQTATVIRSVNGIVKTHLSTEPVRLAVPFYLGR